MDQPDKVDATLAATYACKLTGHAYKPGTVRQWANRRHIARYGRRGRATLYDLREIHIYLTGHDPYEEGPIADLEHAV